MDRTTALEHYERLVATNPAIKRKGATIPYTSHNGHMFSMLTTGGQAALRLPEKERAAFLKKYRTTLCEQYGVVQVEYVLVPHRLLARTAELKPFFDLSHAYVAAKKPKPARARKAAGGKASSAKKAAPKGSRTRARARKAPARSTR
ncbi:MAG TPA: hypothetical protein VHW65_09005 [Gemmatimonadales bacterium]|jgi:hypothetical protein|nr:hypothetical protein [Gemmatimonadales bacterium]